MSLDKNETVLPTFVTLAELPSGELHEGSGIYENDGRELTNYAAMEMIGQVMGGVVFTSSNGSLSESAKKRNSEITRSRDLSPSQKAAEFMVSVRLMKPPETT